MAILAARSNTLHCSLNKLLGMTLVLLMAVLGGGCGASAGQAGSSSVTPEHTPPSGLGCGRGTGAVRLHARQNRNAVDGFDSQRCYAPANDDLRH